METSKRKVLIVNKFYYPRGGDCVCTINLESLLGDEGWETAMFAMDYPSNDVSPWTGYFASRVDFAGGLGDKIKALQRALGLGDIKRSFLNILDDFRPDIVHLNNIHSYLSPVLASLAKRRGAKVVWTLHDYKLICPSYSCLRDGRPCEDCFNGKLPVLKRRCMKGSLAASAIAWIEAVKWSRTRLENDVEVFICPSDFMRSKMIQGGFSPEKLVTLCNFVDPVKLDVLKSGVDTPRIPQLCYVGRLSPEKGVATMLEAARRSGVRIKVAGDGPLRQELKKKYCDDNIEFTGPLDAYGVASLLISSVASVMPSEWYENNPLGVIESLCAGTPVVGTDIGGIPELINSGHTGIIVPPGDIDAMAEGMRKAIVSDWNHHEIAAESQIRFSPQTHYTRLRELYK